METSLSSNTHDQSNKQKLPLTLIKIESSHKVDQIASVRQSTKKMAVKRERANLTNFCPPLTGSVSEI